MKKKPAKKRTVKRAKKAASKRKNAARLTEADLARLGPRYRAQIEAQLGKVEQQEAKAKTPAQRKAVASKKRSIFSRMADMLSSRKRAAKKAAALEAKAKLLRVKAARPTLRARAKKRVAKGAHGLVSRILGNPRGKHPAFPYKVYGVRVSDGKREVIGRAVATSEQSAISQVKKKVKDGWRYESFGAFLEKSNPSQSQRGAGSTRSEVRSPTKTEVRSPTSTSTHAKTTGNFTATVTGGAGAGATNVKIYTRGKKGNPSEYLPPPHPRASLRVRRDPNEMNWWRIETKDPGGEWEWRGHINPRFAPTQADAMDAARKDLFRKKSNPKRRNSNVMRARGAVVASSNPRKNSPKRSVRKKKIYTHMGTKKTGYKMKLIKTRKKRRNGESGADKKRREFTGRRVGQRNTMLAANGTPKKLAALGKITCIQLRGHSPLNFDEREAPMLAVNPAGDHLYIVGGKRKFARNISGRLEKIGYLARKSHINGGGTYDYRHKFDTAPTFSVDAEGFGKIGKARYVVTSAGIEG